MDIFGLIVLLLLVSPLAAGVYVAFAESDGGVKQVNRVEGWISESGAWAKQHEKIYLHYIMIALIFPLSGMASWTSRIEDPYLRSGVRAIAWGYLALSIAALLALLAYGTIMIVIFLLMLLLLAKLFQFMKLFPVGSKH